MVAVAITNDVTRVWDFDSAGGTYTAIGGFGAVAGRLTVLEYEGTGVAAAGFLNLATGGGLSFEPTSTFDWTTTRTFLILKFRSNVSTGISATGLRFGIGSSSGNYYLMQVYDDGTMGEDQNFLVPSSSGWIVWPVQITATSNFTLAKVGSPDLDVIDYYRLTCDSDEGYGAVTSSPSLLLDSIDANTNDALGMTGGTGANDPGVFQDFIDYDEDTHTNRFGLWTRSGKKFETFFTTLIGKSVVSGGSVATEFSDSFKTIVFPSKRLDQNGLAFDITLSTQIYTLNDCEFIGEGRPQVKRFFDTERDVEKSPAGTNEIHIPGHGFSTGDQVKYENEGGTEDIGPDETNGESVSDSGSGIGTGPYHYIVWKTADTVSLAATASNALAASPTVETLTPSTSGNGENHSLEKLTDGRPSIQVTGTAGSVDFNRCNLFRHGQLQTRDGASFVDCILSGGFKAIVGTFTGAETGEGVFSGCTFNQPILAEGDSFLVVQKAGNVSEVTDCKFIAGENGHAMVLQNFGAATTVTFDGLIFEGYFAADSDNTGGWSFNASTDVDSGTDVITITGHPFATGDAVVYGDEGGTPITGLADGGLYYARDVSANTLTLHPSSKTATENLNKIGLTSGSSETHKLYSARAAIFNDTNEALTINVINGGTVPSVRNGTGSTVSVIKAVTVRVTALDNGAVPPSAINTARVLLEADAGGALPHEASVTITRSASTATISHTGHGLSTGSKVVIRGANQPPYNGVRTITVTSPNAYTYTVTGTPASPATGTITSTAVILDGETNASGVIETTTFNYTADQPVTGVVRQASAADSPKFKAGQLVGTIVSTGLFAVALLTRDE